MVTPICGLNDGFYPLEMATSANIRIIGLYPISGLFEGIYPDNV